MLKILLECTKNMFASKGIWTGESERLKTRSRGESTEKGGARPRYRASICPYQRNILKENKAPAFLRRRKSDCREVGCAEEGGEVQKKGTSSGLFEHRCGRKSEGRELWMRLCASGHHKKIPPLRRRKLLHSFVAKAQKGKGSTFVFALGSSALPLVIDEAF